MYKKNEYCTRESCVECIFGFTKYCGKKGGGDFRLFQKQSRKRNRSRQASTDPAASRDGL